MTLVSKIRKALGVAIVLSLTTFSAVTLTGGETALASQARTISDAVDHGRQEPTIAAADVPSTGPICFTLVPDDHLPNLFEVSITTHTSSQLLDGSRQSTRICSEPVKAGPASIGLTASGGKPGSVLTLEIALPQPGPSWSTIGSLIEARERASSSVMLRDGRVFLVGGPKHRTGDYVATNTAEVFDPETGEAYLTAPMPSPELFHSDATLLADGRVLLVAGVPGAFQIYNPTSDSWQETLRIPTGWNGVASLDTLPSGDVLVMTRGVHPTAEIFDVDSGTSRPIATPPFEVWGIPRVTLDDGRIAFMATQDETFVQALAIFDPLDESWSMSAPIPEGRGSPQLVLLHDGRVMMIGGSVHGYQVDPRPKRPQFYDPATDAWSFGSPMHHGRIRHSAVVLPDGRIVVTGGDTSWAEVYDAPSDIWTLLPLSGTSRHDHFSVVTEGGVLLLGGHRGDGKTGVLEVEKLTLGTGG